MGLQDDRMSGNIQDIARLITRLLLNGDMPQYTLPAAEADYTEADHLFKKVIGLADEGDINGAENELLMNMEDDDPDYLELALTFYLYLNDMDGDYLDDHGDGIRSEKDIPSDQVNVIASVIKVCRVASCPRRRITEIFLCRF